MCRVDYGDDEGAWITEPHHEVEIEISLPCCECGRTIEPLETHTSFEWAYEAGEDGEPISGSATYRKQFCAQCEAAGHWLDKVCGGHLYGSDQIYEDLLEHWDEEPPPIVSLNLGRLIAGMRRQWKRRDGSLIPAPVVKAWASAGAAQALAPVAA